MRSKGLAVGIADGYLAVAGPGTGALGLAAFVSPGRRGQAGEPSDLAGALERALATVAPGSPLNTIVVGSDLARHWIQPAVAGAASLREIQSVAALRFSELFSEAADGWRITGDWRCGAPFLCAAVPRWAVDLAATQVRSTETLLGAGLAASAGRWPDDGWCCLQTPQRLVLIRKHKGLPVHVRSAATTPNASDEDVQVLAARRLQQEAARLAEGPVERAEWIRLTPGAATTGAEVVERHGVRFQIHDGLTPAVVAAEHWATPAAIEAAVCATLGVQRRGA